MEGQPPVPRRILDVVKDSVGRWARENPQLAEGVAWLLAEAAKPPLRTEPDVGTAERIMRRFLPANWWELSVAEHRVARQAMIASGLCLSWVPSTPVVRRLIHADDEDQRRTILVEEKETILTDVDAALEKIDEPALRFLTESCRQCVDSLRDGRDRAAQALAAAGISTIVADVLGEKRFAAAHREIKRRHPDEVGLLAHRRALIEWALAAAIESARDDPPPFGFNRHLTAHRVDAVQYRAANALSALLLFAGLLRELQDLYEVGDAGIPLKLAERAEPASG